MLTTSKDWANMQHRYIELFLNSTTGASNGEYSSQMMQSMRVLAQSTYSGLERQFVSRCYGASCGGQTAWGYESFTIIMLEKLFWLFE
uniref:Uncharacterized protein n=1 Tax=Ursus maritimus TaxID=29073 RepID=A0A452TVE5_URSMA